MIGELQLVYFVSYISGMTMNLLHYAVCRKLSNCQILDILKLFQIGFQSLPLGLEHSMMLNSFQTPSKQRIRLGQLVFFFILTRVPILPCEAGNQPASDTSCLERSPQSLSKQNLR